MTKLIDGNYKNSFKFTISLGVILSLAGCSTSPHGNLGENPFKNQEQVETFVDSETSGLKVLFFGHVAGESQPCGCGMNPKGGLDRRLAFVRRSQKTTPKGQAILKVNAGNSLFPSEVIHGAQQEKLKIKALEILKAHKLMGVDFQNVGFLDLSGLPFLKNAAQKSGIELISLNLVDPVTQKLLFSDQKRFSSEDFGEVVVVGLTAGLKRTSKEFLVLNPEETLLKFAATLEKKTKLIVLSDLGQEADLALAPKLQRPALIIGSRDPFSLEIPLPVGRSLVVRSQFQGQQWGELLIHGKDGWQDRWYGYSMGRSFSDLWEARKSSFQQIASGPASKERDEELDKLRSVQNDLEIYGHGDWKQANLFKHKLVDLTDGYLEKIELTEIVKKLK